MHMQLKMLKIESIMIVAFRCQCVCLCGYDLVTMEKEWMMNCSSDESFILFDALNKHEQMTKPI